MLFSLDMLAADVARRVSQWDRQVVTSTETVGWLLDRFAFALEDFPAAWSDIAKRMESIPAPLLKDMAVSLAHMHVNRFIRSAARAHEMVLYDFLFQTHRARAARARKHSPAAG